MVKLQESMEKMIIYLIGWTSNKRFLSVGKKTLVEA